MTTYPLLLEPAALADRLDADDLQIVDLCKNEQYQSAHIPGAVHIEYSQLIAARPPVMGLLPDEEQLKLLAAAIGLDKNRHVVAYDDEGGGKAARLLWTLDVMGHTHWSLLNGGIHAWSAENRPMEATPIQPKANNFDLQLSQTPVANREQVLASLEDRHTLLLDARSVEEYKGVKKFAERAGHIPGALNLDWLHMIDQNNNLKLKPVDELQALYEPLIDNKDKAVIVYCQTHHRSALSYFTLKYLGYSNIKGYPGSWSDWGNAADTPIEA